MYYFFKLQFVYCLNVGNRLLNSILLHLNSSRFKGDIRQITCLEKILCGRWATKQKQKRMVKLYEGKDIANSD